MSNSYPVSGAGLGFRREMISQLDERGTAGIDFMEIAPENWIGVGGKFAKSLRRYTEQLPFVTHGLSLSIGSPAPLDEKLVYSIRDFIRQHGILAYSEHLTYCSDDGHLYDLLPIPFTEEAVHYVAGRIKRVQDILEQRIAIENASYYTLAPGSVLTEIDFINAVLEEADCDLLLDVNNIYVNSVNHRYDAVDFMKSLPAERISYAHIAGHYNEAEDLIVDTHGADIIQPVWNLLDLAYEQFGVFPTLVERDFNIPPLQELMTEVSLVQKKQNDYTQNKNQAHG